MASPKNGELCGIVLAGGKSSRLGQDKTRLIINGQNLLERMLSLAGIFCPRTYCVGRDIHVQGIRGPWMLDEIPGIGPMGGIITALKTLNSPCLVLACDLPCLDQATVRLLIDHRNARKNDQCMTTFYQEKTGFIEALVSIYEPQCLELLLASRKQGCYKLSRAIPSHRRCHIPYDPDQQHLFFNVNYPHDLDTIITGSPNNMKC